MPTLSEIRLGGICVLKLYLINREFFFWEIVQFITSAVMSVQSQQRRREDLKTWQHPLLTLTELPPLTDINCFVLLLDWLPSLSVSESDYNLRAFPSFLTDVCCQLESHSQLEYTGLLLSWIISNLHLSDSLWHSQCCQRGSSCALILSPSPSMPFFRAMKCLANTLFPCLLKNTHSIGYRNCTIITYALVQWTCKGALSYAGEHCGGVCVWCLHFTADASFCSAQSTL